MEGVPACLLALSAAAPRCARGPSRPWEDATAGLRSHRLGRGPARPPPQAGTKAPRGCSGRAVALSPPREAAPAGRRLGPAGPPPRAAAATRVPAGIWKRSWLPAPLQPGEAPGATPAALGWAAAPWAALARSRPGMLTARRRLAK